MFKKLLSLVLVVLFIVNQVGFAMPANMAYGQNLLPSIQLDGLQIKDGEVDFLWSRGGEKIEQSDKGSLEFKRALAFFFTALAVPKKDWWVNLNILIDESLSTGTGLAYTELGRALLDADLKLKRLAMDKMNGDEGLAELLEERRLRDISLRFWMEPKDAEIQVDNSAVMIKKANLAVNVESSDKEIERYLSIYVSPKLEEEINNNKEFGELRSAYKALILAEYYKGHFKGSVRRIDETINRYALPMLSAGYWSRKEYLVKFTRLYFSSGEEGITAVKSGGFYGNNLSVSVLPNSAGVMSSKNMGEPEDKYGMAGIRFEKVPRDKQDAEGKNSGNSVLDNEKGAMVLSVVVACLIAAMIAVPGYLFVVQIVNGGYFSAVIYAVVSLVSLFLLLKLFKPLFLSGKKRRIKQALFYPYVYQHYYFLDGNAKLKLKHPVYPLSSADIVDKINYVNGIIPDKYIFLKTYSALVCNLFKGTSYSEDIVLDWAPYEGDSLLGVKEYVMKGMYENIYRELFKHTVNYNALGAVDKVFNAIIDPKKENPNNWTPFRFKGLSLFKGLPLYRKKGFSFGKVALAISYYDAKKGKMLKVVDWVKEDAADFMASLVDKLKDLKTGNTTNFIRLIKQRITYKGKQNSIDLNSDEFFDFEINVIHQSSLRGKLMYAMPFLYKHGLVGLDEMKIALVSLLDGNFERDAESTSNNNNGSSGFISLAMLLVFLSIPSIAFSWDGGEVYSGVIAWDYLLYGMLAGVGLPILIHQTRKIFRNYRKRDAKRFIASLSLPKVNDAYSPEAWNKVVSNIAKKHLKVARDLAVILNLNGIFADIPEIPKVYKENAKYYKDYSNVVGPLLDAIYTYINENRLRNFLGIAWNDFSLEAAKHYKGYGIPSGEDSMDTDKVIEALTDNIGEEFSGVAREKFEAFINSEDFGKMSSYEKLLNIAAFLNSIHMISNVRLAEFYLKYVMLKRDNVKNLIGWKVGREIVAQPKDSGSSHSELSHGGINLDEIVII